MSVKKKSSLKKNLFFHFNLIKRNQKTCNFFHYWKINLGICHKIFFFFFKQINVAVTLSKISMLKKHTEIFIYLKI